MLAERSSLRAIARELKISHVSVYNYMISKKKKFF